MPRISPRAACYFEAVLVLVSGTILLLVLMNLSEIIQFTQDVKKVGQIKHSPWYPTIQKLTDEYVVLYAVLGIIALFPCVGFCLFWSNLR
mmetsp:Transcript_21700/g.51476  ORF Transcript_21700/g.51476 Transcript_21700/m.51476 type:complete len:90 (-) Transcript_21700:346-615(-)